MRAQGAFGIFEHDAPVFQSAKRFPRATMRSSPRYATASFGSSKLAPPMWIDGDVRRPVHGTPASVTPVYFTLSFAAAPFATEVMDAGPLSCHDVARL